MWLPLFYHYCFTMVLILTSLQWSLGFDLCRLLSFHSVLSCWNPPDNNMCSQSIVYNFTIFCLCNGDWHNIMICWVAWVLTALAISRGLFLIRLFCNPGHISNSCQSLLPHCMKINCDLHIYFFTGEERLMYWLLCLVLSLVVHVVSRPPRPERPEVTKVFFCYFCRS